MQSISTPSRLVNIDKVCDYLPIVSTVTNIIDIFQKCVILPLAGLFGVKKGHYYTYLDKKSFVRCLSLLIPILGNIAIWLHDRKESNKALDRINPKPVVPSGPRVDFLGGAKRCPDAVSLSILSCVSFTGLAGVCRVSKAWQGLASDPLLLKRTVYRDIAFGSQQWTRCLNKGLKQEEMIKYEYNAEEFASLPLDIGKILKSSCLAFPGKRVVQTHMLVRLSRGFTVKSLGELAKRYFPQNPNGYRYIWDAIAKEHGDTSVDEPIWLLMTREVLLGSRGISFAKQQAMVAKLAEDSQATYEVPTTLEAVTCIFAQYFSSSLLSNDPSTYKCLFGDTYTRTQWKTQGFQDVVGGFALSGLCVNHGRYDVGDVGVAGLRKSFLGHRPLVT